MPFFGWGAQYLKSKSILLLNILVLITAFLLSSSKNSFGKDSDSDTYIPKALSRTVKRITKKDTSDQDKFLHIARWIIKKKSYDTKGYEEIRLKNYSMQKLWRSKKLLCREYTRLLEAMCKEAKINCFNVDGYVKAGPYYPFKEFYFQEHEWNVIQLDGKNQIVDLTWASGYMAPKISLWGRIRIALNLPYIPRHLKFVKEPNLYYLNIPPEELTKTHLPVHPMWQLSSHPISIKRFETEYFPKTDTNTIIYPYASKIHQYDSQSELYGLLTIADEGYAFNTKNNYNKGAGYLQYSYKYWKGYCKLKESPSIKIKKSDILIKKSQESEVFLKLFLQDNKAIYQHLRDSLKTKNREVLSFIGKYSTLTTRKAKEARKRIRANVHKDRIADIKKARRWIQQKRHSEESAIHSTGRGRNASNDSKKVESIKASIEKNEEQLVNLKKSIPTLDSAFAAISQSHPIQDSIIKQEEIKNRLIEFAKRTLLLTNNKYYLRRIHQLIDSIQNQINTYEKELTLLERYDNIKLIKSRDSVCMRAIKLVLANKKMIVQLKKTSFEDNNEESLYTLQNDHIHYLYSELDKSQHFLSTSRRRNNVFYEDWESSLKYFQKGLRKYSKFEKYAYLSHLKAGRYRYKRYDFAGRTGIAQAILLKRKALVIKNTANKLLRKK